jgi:hypothetical protein
MQSPRLLSAILLAGATSVWAQLPPSALNPTRPAQPQPARPPVTAAPATPAATPAVRPPTRELPPGFPGEPAPAAPASAVPAVDLTNTVPNTLTAEEAAQGWKLLFDGKRLIGWRGVQKNDPIAAGWKVQDGELTLPKDIQQMDKITGGDLATVEQFWDFDFRFEWRATVSANSGVRYLVNMQMGQPANGLEYQIIDDVHNSLSLKGGRIRQSASLDNVLPRSESARLRVGDPLMKRADPWNEGRIVVQGTRVEHWLNGEKVLEFALGPQLRSAAERNLKRDELFATRPHALFGMKGKTPIVLVDQGTEVSFRNLKVRPLQPQAVAPGTPQGNPAYGQRSPVPNPFLLPPKPPVAQPR